MEKGAVDESARQASQVRVGELRHLERCERGLAGAYQLAGSLPGVPDHQLAEIAARHLSHAELLRGRILALGGTLDADPEDVWVSGTDAGSLQFGEHQSLATYHDHLSDFDAPTADAVVRFILPEHAEALELLDPTYARDRDGDL